MALTRKFLSAKGIEDEDVISAIIAAHRETVDGLKDTIDELKKFEEDAKRLKDVEKELSDLKEKGGDWEAKYQKEHDDFDAYKKNVENTKVREAKEKAYKAILVDAGIPEKHHAKIIKYSDVDALELDEEGNAKNAKEILKSVKEEWADHAETTQKSGAETFTPPQGDGKPAYDTSRATALVSRYNAERYGATPKKEGN